MTVSIKVIGEAAKAGLRPFEAKDLDTEQIKARLKPLTKKISEPIPDDEVVLFDMKSSDKAIKGAMMFAWLEQVAISKDSKHIILLGEETEVAIDE